MKRTLLVLLLAIAVASQAAANGDQAQPNPIKHRFENLMLLTAAPSDLRLFFPSPIAATSLQLQHWNDQLDAYSQQWQQQKGLLSDQKLLEGLFYDVHRRYLKHYTPYTGLPALLEGGEYNCLSATALYAQLLNRLGYTYEIVESTHHLVLLVRLGKQQLLLESTDPTDGFVTEAAKIEERLIKIHQKAPASTYYNLGVNVFKSISLRELAGLQYFNLAAWQFNQGHYQQAAETLQKGELLYPSSRFSALRKLIASR